MTEHGGAHLQSSPLVADSGGSVCVWGQPCIHVSSDQPDAHQDLVSSRQTEGQRAAELALGEVLPHSMAPGLIPSTCIEPGLGGAPVTQHWGTGGRRARDGLTSQPGQNGQCQLQWEALHLTQNKVEKEKEDVYYPVYTHVPHVCVYILWPLPLS